MKSDTEMVLDSGMLDAPTQQRDGEQRGDDQSSFHVPAWAATMLGMVIVLGCWIFAATVWGVRKGVPQPWSVVAHLVHDWHYYPRNVGTTFSEAWRGYLIGNALAIVIGVMFVLVPFLEKALMQIAVATYCLPIVAVGPILQATLKGDAPKIALVSLSVVFTTLIGVLVGLRSADRHSIELIKAYGGNRFSQLVKVRIRSALPSTFAGLQIAAPAAILGAIIGEFFGGDRGLGIFMIASLQANNVARTWGIGFLATALAGVGFFATTIAARYCTAWAPGRARR
ncbi:MAG: binding-protein-dependent transport system inner rane component [Acidimicrobiales bacterium]|nr:binding-protein-dependent transport system inner rane component [Acidimicrobiales bacterium]